jgi:dTDP-L-rhamnose 4-epimerase
MSRVFITGGAGFIGMNLIRVLGEVHEICIFDNLSQQVHGQNPKIDLPQNVSIVVGDVRNKAALVKALEDFQPEYVYHLAAETGTGQSLDEISRYCDVNVTGTANLLEAIRASKVALKQIILPSSRAVYGEGPWLTKIGEIACPKSRNYEKMKGGVFNPEDPQTGELLIAPVASKEEMPPNPVSIYASTKLMQEYLLDQAAQSADWKFTILRLQNVYGAGQSLKNPYTGVLSIFCGQILRGEQVNVFEDGEITRDFIYVTDVARALAMALGNERGYGQIFNIGYGGQRTILDTTKTLIGLFPEYKRTPKINGQFRIGDIRAAFTDVSKAREILDWKPEVDLEQGLKKLVEWVVKEK